MPRPVTPRRIQFRPGTTYFKPAGLPLSSLEEVVLAFEEIEALRLKDVEGLGQTEAAKKMNISQPTLFRILSVARKKIADALVNGKAIRVEGGNYDYRGANKCFGFGRGAGRKFGRDF
jgi:uncharacterized protein